MHPLEQLCQDHGISRYRLSKLTGIGESTFSNITVNHTKLYNMSFGTVSTIAKAFNMTIDELEKKWLEYEKTSNPIRD